MPWQELTKIALLGTENSTFSGQTLKTLQAQGIDVEMEAPLVLAEGAALHSQLRKAGFQLEDFTGELPEVAAAANEKKCSLKSSQHLQLILEGQFGAVLPEFIHHLLLSGKVFPTEHLPGLMRQPGAKNYWEKLDSAIGAGGYWLLSQHPEWRQWLENASDFDWQTGSRDQRLTMLRNLRKSDPGRALELVQSTWSEEDYRDKAAFLSEMEWGLSSADEDFIEKCLEEGRKEVRQEAAKLLALLPESRFSERMFSRAVACLKWGAEGLGIQIPDQVSEAAVKDGVLKIHPGWKGGAKAGYLGQVVSVVPPERWEVYFEKTPSEILKLFSQTDWAGTLLRATAEASIFHRNEAWVEALLEYWFENESSPLWNAPFGNQLLELAPAEVVNRLAIRSIENYPGLPEESSPVFKLLQNNAAAWENTFSKLLIRRFQEWILNSRQPHWQTFHHKEYLKMAALRCHPDLLGDLQKGWPVDSHLWALWEKPVEEMLNAVLFRQEMVTELHN